MLSHAFVAGAAAEIDCENVKDGAAGALAAELAGVVTGGSLFEPKYKSEIDKQGTVLSLRFLNPHAQGNIGLKMSGSVKMTSPVTLSGRCAFWPRQGDGVMLQGRGRNGGRNGRMCWLKQKSFQPTQSFCTKAKWCDGGKMDCFWRL